MQAILLYTGAVIIFLWGIGHLWPTRDVVNGFGSLTPENRRIITMEWIAEGLTLCFIGILVGGAALLLGTDKFSTHMLALACAIMLFILAGLSLLTGARTSILPMKLCPIVKTLAGVGFVMAILS